jgi:hypothetical protein
MLKKPDCPVTVMITASNGAAWLTKIGFAGAPEKADATVFEIAGAVPLPAAGAPDMKMPGTPAFMLAPGNDVMATEENVVVAGGRPVPSMPVASMAGLLFPPPQAAARAISTEVRIVVASIGLLVDRGSSTRSYSARVAQVNAIARDRPGHA